jgi:hypothetical protein
MQTVIKPQEWAILTGSCDQTAQLAPCLRGHAVTAMLDKTGPAQPR